MLRKALSTLAAVAAGLGLAASASGAADFGFAPGSLYADLTGPTATQAGAAADLEFGFRMNSADPADPHVLAGTIRDLYIDLPKGLIANPTPVDECPLPLVNQIVSPCPATSAVGKVDVALANPGLGIPTPPTFAPTSRVYRVPAQGDEAAAFAFNVVSTLLVRMSATAMPDGGYRIRTSALRVSEATPMYEAKVTLWGVPAEYQGPGQFGFFGGPLPPDQPRHRFLSVPTRCDGDPLRIDFTASPWSSNYSPFTTGVDLPMPSGCDQLEFDPSLTVTPEHQRAGQPSGYKIDLEVPQNTDAMNGLETPNLKDAVVKLPEGVAISPPQANGLEACSDAQIDLHGNSAPSCPEGAKIGEVLIDTPLLDDPVPGNIFIGTQESDDPESGEMYRIFIAARAPGVRLKLKGQIRADKATGQLATTFADNPELPFSKFSLIFKGGDTAPLVNPPTCGTHTATSTLAPWGGPVADPSSSFTIGEGCPSGGFSPWFTGGTMNPLAGSFAPFTMTVGRSDADRNLSSIRMDLPSGLLAALGSVPLCPEANAAAGSCPAVSQIGSTTVDVGAGGAPYRLRGTVAVGGPYKGAPFSLSVAVPAKAGPFDLGIVVVRAALHVDANNAKVTAVTDPFPEIVGGVPVSLKTVNVALDRPGFMFNATSCQPSRVYGTFGAVGGVSATGQSDYQARGCDALKLDPKLALQWAGKTEMRKDRHPGLKAKLGDMLGQANLKRVKVTLPLTAALDPGNAKALCEPSAAAINQCPADSRVGWASASTPALHERIEGPVYFVRGIRISSTGREVPTLPKLYVPLSGEGVRVDLWADSDVDSRKRLVSTFTNVPDVPVRDFELSIHGGANGILKATNDVCGASKTTTIEYTGHNAGVTRRQATFTAPDCLPQIVSAENSRNATLPVRVGGIGAGTLTLTGNGIGKATRKVVRSDTALVRASFSQAAQRQLRAGRSLRTRLTVRYAPTRGKAINIRKTVRIAAVRR